MTKKIDDHAIKAAVREKYRQAAGGVEGRFPYPTGKQGAEKLGYDPAWTNAAPKALIETFCGIGCPFHLGTIHPGEAVLDVGCGGGFDLYCAGRLAGAEGAVYGIDLTLAMAGKAARALAGAEGVNARVQVGDCELLPYADKAFEVVISNGALNLSPVKDRTYAELWRVLKPGGRLQYADLVLKEGTVSGAAGAQAWAD